MPKVNVYPLPNPDGTDADSRVEVGWHPHGGVQIATTKLQPGAEHWQDYVPPSDGSVGQFQPAWDGQFVDLNRDQINNLIRALREARDKSYGRDE